MISTYDKMMKNRVNETNTELTTVEEEHKQLVEKNNTENEEFEKDEKNTMYGVARR